MLLHVVRVHVPVELGELGAVGVAVAGGMTENRGIGVQLVPAAELVFAVGVVAAPGACLLYTSRCV